MYVDVLMFIHASFNCETYNVFHFDLAKMKCLIMGISFVNKLNKAGRDYRYVWP